MKAHSNLGGGSPINEPKWKQQTPGTLRESPLKPTGLKYHAIKQMIEGEPADPKGPNDSAKEEEMKNQASMMFGESLLMENSRDGQAGAGSKLEKMSEIKAVLTKELEKIPSKPTIEEVSPMQEVKKPPQILDVRESVHGSVIDLTTPS